VGARVLVIDDEVRFRELYRQVLEQAGFEARTAGSAEEALGAVRSDPPAMVVSDVRLPGRDGLELLREVRGQRPDLPFLLVTAYADVRDAVEALKLGAVDYLAKPVDLDELVAAVRDALGVHPQADGWEVPEDVLGALVVKSPAMRAVVRDAWRVARSEATVLLTGESGTGKEVIAELIHRGSSRRRGPLVAVNCGAIPAELMASELFGHEKGAFTGAGSRRTGRFREAHGGTLLLDEIGELPLDLQPALLRVLETGRVTPVGGDGEIEVDYRLVASTNRDLEAAIAERRFRRDLYYRLNVVALDLPPLRERPEDVVPLARHFLARAGHGDRRLSAAAVRCLESHPWPGNVRELANAMERAALMSHGDVILPENLPPAVRAAAADSAPPETGPARSAEKGETLLEREVDYVREVLLKTGGNRTRAAEILGITRRGLIYKIKRYGL